MSTWFITDSMRCSHLPSTAEEQPLALKANVTALPILAAPHEVHVRITSSRSRSADIEDAGRSIKPCKYY
jgi:hypothetical protein